MAALEEEVSATLASVVATRMIPTHKRIEKLLLETAEAEDTHAFEAEGLDSALLSSPSEDLSSGPALDNVGERRHEDHTEVGEVGERDALGEAGGGGGGGAGGGRVEGGRMGERKGRATEEEIDEDILVESEEFPLVDEKISDVGASGEGEKMKDAGVGKGDGEVCIGEQEVDVIGNDNAADAESVIANESVPDEKGVGEDIDVLSSSAAAGIDGEGKLDAVDAAPLQDGAPTSGDGVANQSEASPVHSKPPVFRLEGAKWLVSYYTDGDADDSEGVVVEVGEMKQYAAFADQLVATD